MAPRTRKAANASAEKRQALLEKEQVEATLPEEVDEVEDVDEDSSQYSGLEDEPDTDEADDEAEDDSDDDVEEEDDDDEDDGGDDDDESAGGDDDGEEEEEEDADEIVIEAATKLSNGSKGPSAVGKQIMNLMGLPGYDNDSDTDTDDDDIHVRNTRGNIPIEWYDDLPHLGYDLAGKPIAKPVTGDKLDEFLAKMDDPDYWKKFKDDSTQEDVKLTDEDIEIIRRIQQGAFPDPEFDPYPEYIDWFTREKMIHPLKNAPEPKSRFLPSKWEHKTVMKLVRAIRKGIIKPRKPADKDSEVQQSYYDVWEKEVGQLPLAGKRLEHITAPKLRLPAHEESYNPPPEYLLDEQEQKAWEEEDHPLGAIMPQKYKSLRDVPAYNKFIQERFERCLDLYLCPRAKKVRMNVNPEDLLPELPDLDDLRPYPTKIAVTYEGHTGRVRSVSVDPSGHYLASGSDDCTMRIWEISTGRCLSTNQYDSAVSRVQWCPNSNLYLIVVATDQTVHVVIPKIGVPFRKKEARKLLSSGEIADSTWRRQEPEESKDDLSITIDHNQSIKDVTWHKKGDYIAVVTDDSTARSVVVHQISEKRSQFPFAKPKGLVQRVIFHPTEPLIFVATQQHIRIYNLVHMEMVKKLNPGSKWISSIAIHPEGDNLIVSSYDRRLNWFDLELSSEPYKTLRFHKAAIRRVAFSNKHPLFASASDDCTVQVFHGMVYADLMQNPLIVPVKVLRGHEPGEGNLGVLDVTFHPTQPWLFTAGADKKVFLYT
eukprot:Clim_evm6s226 gene=Clim_evmTU6s226